jgi:hypothetical protein
MNAYESIEHLLIVDHLLLPLLVNICPVDEDFGEVFSIVPTYLSIARLVYCVESVNKTSFSSSEVAMFSEFVKKFTGILNRTSYEIFEECDATFKGVLRLFELICKKLRSETLSIMNILESAISLLFCSCKKFLDFSPNSAVVVVQSGGTKEMWKKLYRSLLDDLFIYHYSPKFGNPDDKRKKFRSAQPDIKAFEQLAAIECPEEFRDKWHTEVLCPILKTRVARIPDNMMIELLALLDKVKNPHSIIKDTFSGAVIQSFNNRRVKGEELKELYESTEQKQTVRSIMSNLITKRFPRGLKEVSLDCLLDWHLWPICLTIHCDESISSGEDYTFLCSLAYNTLTNILDQLEKGIVCVQDIEKLMDRSAQFLNLCAATSLINSDDAKAILDRRISECTAFKRQKANLNSFCHALSDMIQVEGKRIIPQAEYKRIWYDTLSPGSRWYFSL